MHFEIPVIYQSPKSSVWEQYAPIIENEEIKELTVYLTDEIADPMKYSELYHRVKNLPADYVVHFIINTPGGAIDSALMIVDAMKTTAARKIGHLSGSIASAGTIIALACDELIIGNYISFMVHNYSTGMTGKGHEIKAYQNFVEQNLTEAFTDFYKGFLTTEEIEEVIDGEDFYFNAKEVEERWLARKEALGM